MVTIQFAHKSKDQVEEKWFFSSAIHTQNSMPSAFSGQTAQGRKKGKTLKGKIIVDNQTYLQPTDD